MDPIGNASPQSNVSAPSTDQKVAEVTGGWRPVSTQDDPFEVQQGVRRFESLTKQASEQVRIDRNSADKRVDLAKSLAHAFTLHGSPDFDYSFANQAVANTFGETDVVWEALVSLLEAHALRAIRRPPHKTAAIVFVRYRGTGKRRPAIWQAWIYDAFGRDLRPQPPFNLDYPVLSATDLIQGEQRNEVPVASDFPRDELTHSPRVENDTSSKSMSEQSSDKVVSSDKLAMVEATSTLNVSSSECGQPPTEQASNRKSYEIGDIIQMLSIGGPAEPSLFVLLEKLIGYGVVIVALLLLLGATKEVRDALSDLIGVIGRVFPWSLSF